MACRLIRGPAALLVAFALAGCTAPSEPLPAEWNGRDLRQPDWTNTTLQPEWSLVLEYPLPAGSTLDWNWFTQNERMLYFQVVQVQGQQPNKMVARHLAEDDSALTTPQSGIYQVIWMNDSVFDASFTWKAREGYSHKLYPPNEGPGCALLLEAEACLV